MTEKYYIIRSTDPDRACPYLKEWGNNGPIFCGSYSGAMRLSAAEAIINLEKIRTHQKWNNFCGPITASEVHIQITNVNLKVEASPLF